MQTYWVRISRHGGYGTWIPTGMVTFKEAVEYIRTYHGDRGQVEEWLLL